MANTRPLQGMTRAVKLATIRTKICSLSPNLVSAVSSPDYESDGMPAFGVTPSENKIAAVPAFVISTLPERQRGYHAQATVREEDGSR